MKILHYFLGFPPYRTGGLTKFACDLMISQVKNNDTVFALWPGQIKVLSKKTTFKKNDSFNGIQSIELINPLPVPLDEGIGIKDINSYMECCDVTTYINFLKDIKPEIIHIHTLMGIHKEFFEAAKVLHIKTIYTTHDYFGICPKVTLFRNNNVCNNDNGCKECVECNKHSLSHSKIIILQSPFYRKFKNNYFIKMIRKKHRQEFSENTSDITSNFSPSLLEIQKYRKLRDYYTNMFKLIDTFHFNSTQSEFIYKKYINPKKYKTLPISHRDIKDNRFVNQWHPTNTLRITYLSPTKAFKGYYALINALDNLWDKGKRNFKLTLFSSVPQRREYLESKEQGYTYNQLKDIFNRTDLLIAPSIWYETFGFTVLEALSYGVPVIVSNHVGAKDIVNNCGIVFDVDNSKSLIQVLECLNIHNIKKMKENFKTLDIPLWDKFLDQIYDLYKE